MLNKQSGNGEGASKLQDTTSAALPAPEQMLGFLLNRIALFTRERTYQALAQYKLVPRDLGVLLCLADDPGIGQRALGRRLALDRTTVSQLIDALVSGGWVEREVDSADRRNFKLRLSETGAARLVEAAATAQAVQREILAALPQQRAERFVEDLGLLVASTDSPTTVCR